ncbi:hypothetical protein ABZ921_01960 [Streptomyces atriruber]|uniref:Uncharacterized protein n=1 Tax=Streptomyces atriruber TaxID=545121 RepID=A0ABV3BED9_9ACTN
MESRPRYQPSTESLLRRLAEQEEGHGFLLMLAREMRSWVGREADARALLVHLAREKRVFEAASYLAEMNYKELTRNPQAAHDVADVASPASRGPDPVAIDLDDAAVIVGAATAVPFVQALATQAGGDVYAWVRQLFGRAVGRRSEELSEGGNEAALHVVGDSAANTWLVMHGRPSDEALAKLAETDLETLAAPDRRGRTVIVYWAPEAGEWQRRVE